MQCQWPCFEYAYSAAFFVCPVVTSDRTHTGISALFLCIQSMLTSNEKRALQLIIVLYTDVLQTLVIIGTHICLKTPYELNVVDKMRPVVSRKPASSV